MNIAKFRLDHGSQFPYDGGDSFWLNGEPPPAAIDWAHAAARGIIADMMDRRGIKWAFEDGDIDQDVRKEIVESVAEIIREALKLSTVNQKKPAEAG